MKKQRIYLDTSVFGGLFDEEFEEFTKPLFERIKKEEFQIIYSNITEDELKFASKRIKDIVKSLPESSTEYVKSDVEVAKLAKKYIDEKVVGKTSFTDCLHIALATTRNADILISWNFKHIVNVVRIIGYNAVNLSEGYKQIDIRSPRELIDYETKVKNKKTFDAVKFMREQRDRITKEIFGLSPKEITEYFDKNRAEERVKPGA